MSILRPFGPRRATATLRMRRPCGSGRAIRRDAVAATQVQNVVKILGLRFGTKYTPENIKTLRYGHLMIMTDQDHDGSCERRPFVATPASPSHAGPTSRAY